MMSYAEKFQKIWKKLPKKYVETKIHCIGTFDYSLHFIVRTFFSQGKNIVQKR